MRIGADTEDTAHLAQPQHQVQVLVLPLLHINQRQCSGTHAVARAEPRAVAPTLPCSTTSATWRNDGVTERAQACHRALLRRGAVGNHVRAQ